MICAKKQLLILAAVAIGVASCTTPEGRATRTGGSNSVELWKRSLLEPQRKEYDYSCSFIELDGNGDFLFPKQLDEARDHLTKVSSTPTILVTYCHGWRNDSQSADVVRFCDFLHKLSISTPIAKNYRVAGLYFSWRGAKIHPATDIKELETVHFEVVEDFGRSPIVNFKGRSNFGGFLREFIELPTYWGRRNVAEAQSSSTALASAIYSLAQTVKRNNAQNKVVAIGHSFGALMMEKCVLPAAISELGNSGHAPRGIGGLDLVILFNSAAPSILAKQFHDVLDRQCGSKGSPMVISVTSEDDKATRVAHPLANTMAGFAERNSATYVLKTRGEQFDVPAGYFFKRTPGHNPFLITHEIVRNTDVPSGAGPYNGDDVIKNNLLSASQDLFYTSNEEAENPSIAWKIVRRPTGTPFYSFEGRGIPVADSRYWVIRCKGPLIHDHGDVWSYRSVELISALFTISQGKIKRDSGRKRGQGTTL